MLDKKTATCLTVYESLISKEDEPRTFICMGTPRGGTSMVAGVMAACGIFMGNDLPQNIEDPEFNRDAHRNISAEAFRNRLPAVIQSRNREHSVWGWKYPRAGSYLEDIISNIRNPHLIIVFRDPVPATMRAEPEDDTAALKDLRNRLRLELSNLRLARSFKKPALMVSYERSIRNPHGFITQLTGFLNVPPPENLDPVLEFMEPGRYKKPLLPTSSSDTGRK